VENQDPQAAFREECQKIHDDAQFSAEVQYLSASRYERIAFWLQVVPAVASALTGTLSIGLPTQPYLRWIAAGSAVITAVATILNPAQRRYAHLSAAKAFTVVKIEARSIGGVFGPTMPLHDFQKAVKELVTRYNDLVRLVPPSEGWAARLVSLKKAKKAPSLFEKSH